jgi:hypothetical protein
MTSDYISDFYEDLDFGRTWESLLHNYLEYMPFAKLIRYDEAQGLNSSVQVLTGVIHAKLFTVEVQARRPKYYTP